MKRIVILSLIGMMVVCVCVGCKSKPATTTEEVVVVPPPPVDSPKRPAWVLRGGGAFPKDRGKAIYGVGIAEAKRVPGKHLRHKAALERAKIDVAGQLGTLVQGVFKDYSEAAMTPNMDTAEARSLTSSVQKSVVDQVLIGCEPQDMWVDPTSEDYHVLVRLSMDSVAKQLKDKIVAVEKGKLRKKAADAHAELDAIIDKYRKAEK